ncbi:lipopolysaccharide biosynthesis protein [uncultured Jatrophihabitans sp.]|uniref:lipopolysaccharide biosynthesis protein n=1 Tax=uncultured Jatrophihabitans sp. TaxID=1610747 RepID=UPI0035CC4BE2
MPARDRPVALESRADTGFKARGVRGFLWTGGQTLVNQTLSLLGFVILARLLDPHDYGIAATANVFVIVLSTLAAAGYSQTLVQKSEVDQRDYDTTFWIGLGTSSVLAVSLCIAAWPLADIYRQPQLRPVLQVLSVALVFVALGSVPQAILQRDLGFKVLARVSMFANVAATIVGISFAFLGFGVWSLIVQTVLSLALSSAGATWRSGYRPGKQFDPTRFKGLFASSRHFMGVSLLSALNGRTDDFLIGAVLGPVALGIYSVAYRILTVLVEVFGTTIQRVAFPVFSRLQGDKQRLMTAYRSAVRMGALVGMPVFIFCLIAAPEIVQVVFGPQWAKSVPVMRILCLFGAQQVIFSYNGALMQAVGRARLVFRMGLASTLLQVAAFAVAVPFGIKWVAASFVIRAYLTMPIWLSTVAKSIGTTVWATLRDIAGPIVSAAIMLCTTFLAEPSLDGLSATIRLVLLGLIAASSYLAALLLCARSVVFEAISYARVLAPSKSVA